MRPSSDNGTAETATILLIEDDGPGIPPDQRAAIFEPFYRIDSSRQRESGGYGLRLAIVRRICDWNRAKVSIAESTLGGGAVPLSVAFRRARSGHVHYYGGVNIVKVLTLCVGVLVICASGCTTRAAYEAVRVGERNRCNELPATERERCLARTQDDFDTYQRKKAEAGQRP